MGPAPVAIGTKRVPEGVVPFRDLAASELERRWPKRQPLKMFSTAVLVLGCPERANLEPKVDGNRAGCGNRDSPGTDERANVASRI